MVKPKADGTLNTETSRDLDAVWSDVVKEYSRITDTQLSNEDSFNTLIRRVNQGIDESSSKNKSKAKDVLNKAATCIQKFGGMIASAASIVFGPAGQCYNAISFVITAGKNIQEVIDGYITLLEHCVAFLQRITMHLGSQRSPGEERLPVHLRGPAYRGLELFLKVQAHSRNLAKSKRTKLKVFCGVVLFSEDDGVKGNLATLTELSTDLTGYTADQILEDVKGLARHLQKSDEERKLHEAECREHFRALGLLTQQTLDSSEKTRALVSQMKSSSDDAENLKKIESSLKAVTDKDVSEKKWVAQHKTIQRERIAETGKWLLDSPKFKLWANINQHDKLSILKGNGGFGKSFLCSHVIDNIITYSKEASNGAVHVGYYYFEKGDSVEDCIGSLVYQWASLDKTYRRAVASACPEAGSFGKTKLWKTLVLDLSGSMQGHYFMIIDGYPGDDDSHFMRDMIRQSILDKSTSVRLFISGRYENLEGLTDDGLLHRLGEGRPGLQRQMSRPLAEMDGDEAIPRPSLANDQDLLDYAFNRIESLCKKNPDLKATLQDPKRGIPAKFARGARGDFTSLESKLNEIAEAQDNDAIEEIISRAGETRKESFDRVLKELYDILAVEEIRELNILLKWVYEARESDEKLLGSVLLWCTGKSYFLGKQIDSKFKSVLRHDQRGIVSGVFAADTIRTATPDVTDGDNQIKSLSQGLLQCEVDIVQHFVKSYCSDELYERFKFHDFFRSKAADQTAIIHLDESQRVSTAILQVCLEVLCEGEKASDSKFAVLREYAAFWLAQHIGDIDLFGPDQKSLQAIGNKLVTLLWDDDAIDAWWMTDISSSLRYDWLEEDEYLQKLMDFLKHPPVLNNMDGSLQSQWVKSTLAEDGSNARILKRVAERLADRWFSAERASMELFHNSQSIMAKIWGTVDDSNSWRLPTPIEIRRFVEFGREHTRSDLSDVHWESRRAAALYACYHFDEALEACREAERQSAGQVPWTLLLVKSKAHFQLKNFQETLTCLHKIEETNSITNLADGSYANAYWDTALLLEGQSHKALMENDAAIQCFVKLLKHGLSDKDFSYVHNKAITELFDTWRQMKYYERIVDHIHAWKAPEDPSLDIHYWLPRLAEEDRFHRLVLLAIIQTRDKATHVTVGQLYDEAIKRLCERRDENVTSENEDWLRYIRASILFHGSMDPDDQAKAITMWEKLLESSDESEYYSWTNYVSVKTLARSLLDKGLADYRCIEQGSAQDRETAATRLQDSVKRLEALVSENTPVLNMCRSGDSDPRLSLARLKLKIGDEQGFKRLVMARLQKQFDKWPSQAETTALVERYSSIAHTLTVADDDENAVAAWQLMALPGWRDTTESDGGETAANGNSSDDADPNPQALPGAIAGEQVGIETPSQDEKATRNNDNTMSDDAVLGASDTNNPPQHEVEADNSVNGNRPVVSEVPSQEEELVFGSVCGYSCDGDCGTSWPVMEDLYACKHCLDVQLCPDCHQKLMHEELPPVVCSPLHDFLYVPSMDRAAWSKIGPNEMIVDCKVMSREAWLDGLRDKWDLRQDQIDARRSRAAARFRAVVGSYVLSTKGYSKDDYKNDPRRIQLVDGVYKWV